MNLLQGELNKCIIVRVTIVQSLKHVLSFLIMNALLAATENILLADAKKIVNNNINSPNSNCNLNSGNFLSSRTKSRK